MTARILIVDDEPSILATMAPLLRGRGYEVSTATTGHAAIEAVDRQPPQLVVLDLGLPDLDGIEVCRRLREGRAIPIIVLSARGAERDKVAALVAGAIVRGDLSIDVDRRRVTRGGDEIRLTPKEFELLVFLAQHPGRVLTHRTILKAIWGANAVDQPEHLRVLVNAVRRKLERDPAKPRYITTEPWVGYRFAED